MDRTHDTDQGLVHGLAALVVGGVVAGGLGLLTGVVTLALVAGACWGVGVGVLLRVRRCYPRLTVGDGWTDARWIGLGVALVTLAALLGVSPALSLSPARQLGLSVLVLGAGLVGSATAMMAERERRSDDTPGDAPSDTPGGASRRRAREVER